MKCENGYKHYQGEFCRYSVSERGVLGGGKRLISFLPRMTPVPSAGAIPVEHPEGTRFNRTGGAGWLKMNRMTPFRDNNQRNAMSEKAKKQAIQEIVTAMFLVKKINWPQMDAD